MCMYQHVSVGILQVCACVCMYLHVCAGIYSYKQVYVGIKRYCSYMQVCQYVQVLHVYVGIAGMGRYVIMSRYCMYV